MGYGLRFHIKIHCDLFWYFSMNLSSVNKLTQLFPKLDGDLGSVGNQFTFDNLVVSGNEVETPQPTNENSSFAIGEVILPLASYLEM